MQVQKDKNQVDVIPDKHIPMLTTILLAAFLIKIVSTEGLATTVILGFTKYPLFYILSYFMPPIAFLLFWYKIKAGWILTVLHVLFTGFFNLILLLQQLTDTGIFYYMLFLPALFYAFNFSLLCKRSMLKSFGW